VCFTINTYSGTAATANEGIGPGGAQDGVAGTIFSCIIANNLPNPPTGLTSSPNLCSIPASEQLDWDYLDPDGDPQDQFEIELTAGLCNFSPADITVGPILSSVSEHAVSGLAGLVYGADYCWRVRVWDLPGDVSPW